MPPPQVPACPYHRLARRSHLSSPLSSRQVDENTTILEAAFEQGLEASVPHDCRMGVCLACAARVSSGEVDQARGFAPTAGGGAAVGCVLC